MELELILCYTSIRIIIPCLLLFAVVIRQNLFSALYLLFLLIAPFLSFTSFRTITKGAIGIYLKLLIILTCLICTAQVSFQIYILAFSSQRNRIDNCSVQGQILSAIGFNQLLETKLTSIFRFFVLDFWVLFISGLVYMFTSQVQRKCINRKRTKEEELKMQHHARIDANDEGKTVTFESRGSSLSEQSFVPQSGTKLTSSSASKRSQRIKKSLDVIRYTSEVLFIALLCLAGILNPSLTSLFYFISFLFIVTYISCNFKLGPFYNSFPFLICALVSLQIIVLFLYQIQFFRSLVPASNLEARLIGLQEYVQLNCTKSKDLIFEDLNWNIFAHPFLLFLLYYLSASFIHRKAFTKYSKCRNELMTGSELPMHVIASKNTESLPLLTGNEAKNYQTLNDRSLQDKEKNTKSNKISNNEDISSLQSSIKKETNSYSLELDENEKKRRFNRLFYFVNLIKRSSYAATLIVMMTWSITYHSWSGFVLLLWSCIIWMMANSRQACLRSSFALVLYAIVMLLIQYIYSLNLTDQELPQILGSVSLKEIGFTKYYDLSYKPLALKVIFTLMFWITLRQYREEKELESKMQNMDIQNASIDPTSRSYLRHLSISSVKQLYTSPSLISLSNTIHFILVKYWIWVVAIMLMVMSVGGRHVVIYRIVYMLLFLSFTFILQLSFKLWRRLMYPFWSIVIIYSMTILIAIYTYQFSNFETYWQQYLHIDIEIQSALGLKKYDADPWVLFTELFTPTFFLIITIIQLRFLHKDFLDLTKLEECQIIQSCSNSLGSQNERIIDSESSSLKKEIKIDIDLGPSTSKQNICLASKNDEQQIEDQDNTNFVESFQEIYNQAKIIYIYLNEILWRFLEIHINKVILFVTIHAALSEVTVIHVNFVFLVVIAISSSKFERFILYNLGFWASFIILAKMIYQLNVVWDSTTWTVNCTIINHDNSTLKIAVDNRLYLGFRKEDDIFDYTSRDLMITIFLTLNAVITIRQRFYRNYLSLSFPASSIIFPSISRQHAENGLGNLIKYLMNYGFYKFGLEITSLVIIISIVNRIDIISVLLGIALIFFIFPKRNFVLKIWPYFLTLCCIIYPLEYLACLGLPPGLCISYPWESLAPELIDWLYLPLNDSSHERQSVMAAKLYYGFFVLLFASRQWIVFKIERNDIDKKYRGGSNSDSYLQINSSNNFEIKDFFTFKPTALDYAKSFFFSCFYWISLAVVFLTAMDPDNLFGVGYISGCFILLWNGNDFYLKPLKTIFTWWKILIAYNVAVIFCKNILGIVACLYSSSLTTDFCWAVHLFGYICNRGNHVSEKNCNTSANSISMTWDTICFAFLLIQKRIFGSYYFSYLVNEIKAQHILASRGVELINEIQVKEVKDQQNAEKKVMEKIKMKMDRIRANQQMVSTKNADKIKYHYQADFQYDESLPHSPEPALSHTLPTVYSPTPSLPTLQSPSSAASVADGKGYLEVVKVPYLSNKQVDSLSSGQSGQATFSLSSSPFEENAYYSYPPRINTPSPNRYSNLPTEELSGDAMITSRTSFRFHQKPPQPISKLTSARRKYSIYSSLEASHDSSIKSGDYYMFDEPDSESINLIEKSHESQVPDPVGEELDKLASIRGLTAFCSQMMKNLSTQQEIEDRQNIEDSVDVGESSKDSAIVSADRVKHTTDSSLTTQYSTLSPTDDSTEKHQEQGLSRKDAKRKSLKRFEKLGQDDLSETGSNLKNASIWQKLEWWLKVIAGFCVSCIISATAKLNVVSRDYRYVSRRLAVEKKALKDLFQKKSGGHPNFNWKKQSQEMLAQIFTSNEYLEHFKEKSPKKGTKESEEKRKLNDSGSATPNPYLDSNIFARFGIALFYAIISHSEFVCYFLVILNQINNASILSLPLPLMVFLWGCLSVPRPTKTFWISVITYTEMIIVFKYVFSFRVWPWVTRYDSSPFWLPRILGIYKKDSSEELDLFLLLALFFHRFMLKSLGLWDLNLEKDLEHISNTQNLVSKDEDKENVPHLKPISDEAEQVIDDSTLRRRKNVPKNSENEESENGLPKDELLEGTELELALPEDDAVNIEYCETELEVVSRLLGANGSIEKSVTTLVQRFRNFFRRLLSPSYSITRDCYAPMFFCDFINFFTVWFGYSSFGSNLYGSDITTYLQENRVPMPFLIMLLLQFAFIVADRALYLRKNKIGRLFFHVFIVLFIHGWLFFGLPALTQRQFTSSTNLAPKFWYIIKSMYLLLSARQIKSGYPTQILGNCFTKKYTLINSILFTLYMMVPFLYDMRLIMDWIWTDTSLQLNEWAIMEDINKQLFERKCTLTFEENFPEPKGQERRRFTKYIRGSLYLSAIMFAIWFPLVLFALGGTVGQSHKPEGFSVEIEFSGYQPIFKMSATSEHLENFEPFQWKRLENEFAQNPFAQNFLSSYAISDATIARINGNSTATWGISPPSQNSLINELEGNSTLFVKVTWFVVRKQSKNQNLDASMSQSHIVEITSENATLRTNLAEMLKSTSNNDPSQKTHYAILHNVFPNYIKIPESGYPTKVDAFGSSFRDVKIVLRKGSFKNGSSSQWWEVSDDCGDNYPFHYLGDGDLECFYLVSVLFNDKVFPGAFLQLISGYGIFGLYTTFVFVVSRIIHGYFADICSKVIYTEMPCVDRVLQLCLDIYLVRESREFGLEEDLYAKLIFVYRSPETLIKWTRPLEPIESKKDETKED